MAKQTINIGTTANDGTGDPLRTAFDKVNSNFTELYNDDTGDVNSIIAGDGISVDTATGNVTVTNTITNNNQLTNGAGYVDGSGTLNRLPKFTDADTIGNSTITDTGTKIGVNNANPTYSLDVYRNEATNILRLQNNTFSSWFGSDATGFSIETNLFKPIVFKPSGVETMTLDSTGNVGIGTSSPSAKLDVSGNGVFQSTSSTNDLEIRAGLAGATNGTASLTLRPLSSLTGTSYARAEITSISTAAGDAALILKTTTDSSGAQERMRITSAGNVGIGTSSPAQKLSIDNGYILIKDNAYDTYFLSKTRSDGSQLVGFQSHGVGALSIHSNGAERMRITSAGNVGIGTSSPDSYWSQANRLVLDTGGNTGLTIKSPTTGNGRIVFTDTASLTAGLNDGGMISYGHTDDSMQFRANGTERMRITSAGNVGIGTSSPSAKMTVAGDISLYNSVTSGNETNNILFKNSIYEIAQIKAIVGAGQLNRGELAFNVDNGGGMGTAMYISRLRYVGIGTDTPSALLEIQTASTSGSEDFQIFSRGESPNYEVFKISRSAGSTELLANQNLTLSADYDANHTSVDSNIIFKTDNAEKMRILPSGGITFNGDTSTSNALDDYEEGTWTPAISFGGGTTGITYGRQGGTYTKIGRQVTVFGDIILSNKGTSVGDARITGLPFTILGTTDALCPAAIRFANVTFANQFQSYGNAGQTYINLEETTEAGITTPLNHSNFVNSSQVMVSLTYFV